MWMLQTLCQCKERDCGFYVAKISISEESTPLIFE